MYYIVYLYQEGKERKTEDAPRRGREKKMKNTKETKELAKRMGLSLNVKKHRNHIAGTLIRNTEEQFRQAMEERKAAAK